MPSRSVSRGRTRSRSRSGSRTPRRSVSPRARTRTPSEKLNGGDRSRSRSPRRRDDSRGSERYRDRSYSRSRSKSAGLDDPALKSTKIVVEKLTKNVNEGHLEEIFGKYGTIKAVDLPMNRHFNTNRGTAYLIYTGTEAAESAIAHMHEAQLDGTVISVSIVLPRRKFSRSPPPARRPLPPLHSDRPPTGSYRDRAPPPNNYGGPGRYRSPPRRRSPPPLSGRGYGSRRPENGGSYGRNRGRSRSYTPSRSRSMSSRSRSRSRSPPRRVRRRDSPTPPPTRAPPAGAGTGRRRRSPSYSSYGSYSRSRSRDRRRSPVREHYGRGR